MARKPQKYQVIYNVIVEVWATDEDSAENLAAMALRDSKADNVDVECMDIVKEEA